MAGERFTAADISVTYALEMAQRNVGFLLSATEQAYLARMKSRRAYERTMRACHTARG